ncbi:hypothetical protein QT902_006725 [Xanthomonas campestris]|uniref:hypothetical protein n=1 Tax=Xanthomonas campestris TaxID=339 RepID=UPI0023782D77|nr:hypothetical protein [Xanthomonas campestris]WDL50830.1 hypothetical protein JH287_02200 [Xanthomonas campestris pv. campestris]
MANSRLMLRGCQLCACIAVMLFCLANSKQQTANSKQQTANSKQQTANSKQQTANSKQQTADRTRRRCISASTTQCSCESRRRTEFLK